MVNTTGSPYVGPMRELPVHDCFRAALGNVRPGTVALVPVRYQGRMVFVIYLDQGAGADLFPQIAEVLILAHRVPAALERLVHERGLAS